MHVFAADILVLGDSLSAAHGIEQNSGWVELLKQRLKKEGYSWEVANASISGETSAGGRTRIDALMHQHQPDVVIIELGANDGLRGLPLLSLKENLAYIIEETRKQHATPLLVGMRLPPNYGPAYSNGFHDIYVQLAKKHNTAFVPFLMDGMADKIYLFQADGLHPTALAQPILLDNVWPHLRPLLKK